MISFSAIRASAWKYACIACAVLAGGIGGGEVRSFLHRLFGHRWRDTHCNRWQITTRQECSCGAIRKWHGGPNGNWTLE